MSHQRVRKTKLIATIGPACDTLETIQAMIRAGMNVARLNFSHGTHQEHRKRLGFIRQAARELGTHTAIMLDTKGVEIRTGRARAATTLRDRAPDSPPPEPPRADAEVARRNAVPRR